MSAKILITGTSSGFGQLMTETLLKEGHAVVASMRGVEGRNSEIAGVLRSAGARVTEIDVTDDGSVEHGVAAAIETLDGLDVVVNNAGIGVLGLQETFDAEDWRRLFDVNVFGVQRVVRAALPTMREQGSGLLIQISSLLGRFVLPFLGPYNASKHALEALSENYRVELSPFGIESVVIEPGGFGTSFADNSLPPSDGDRVTQLGEYAYAPTQMMESFGEQLIGDDAPDPQWVADAVARLVAMPTGERPTRTVVDGLGMGEPIEEINRTAEAMTRAIYDSMGIAHLLSIRNEVPA